jgi:hypothetical protein
MAMAAVLIAGSHLLIAQNETSAVPVTVRPGDTKPGEREGKLKPGDPAADFTLNVMHKEQTVRLSAFKGQRPVALVFGSYT